MSSLLSKSLITLTIAFSASPALAGGSLNGGGGGNARTAKDQKLVEAIHKVDMTRLFFGLHTAMTIQTKDANNTRIDNARIRTILEKFFAFAEKKNYPFESLAIAKAMRETRIDVRYKGSCPDKWKNSRDASQAPGTICLSIPRLRSISSDAVFTQVLALEAHEYAHVMGFGEEDAVLLQDFVLKYGRRLYNADDVALIQNALHKLDYSENWNENDAINKDSSFRSAEANICHRMSMNTGYASALLTAISARRSAPQGAWGENFRPTDQMYYDAQYLHEAFYKISSLCVELLVTDKEKVIPEMRRYYKDVFRSPIDNMKKDLLEVTTYR